jgi:hypothetical protein
MEIFVQQTQVPVVWGTWIVALLFTGTSDTETVRTDFEKSISWFDIQYETISLIGSKIWSQGL